MQFSRPPSKGLLVKIYSAGTRFVSFSYDAQNIWKSPEGSRTKTVNKHRAWTHTLSEDNNNRGQWTLVLRLNLTTSSYVLGCSFPSQSNLPGKSCQNTELDQSEANRNTFSLKTGWCQMSGTKRGGLKSRLSRASFKPRLLQHRRIAAS